MIKLIEKYSSTFNCIIKNPFPSKNLSKSTLKNPNMNRVYHKVSLNKDYQHLIYTVQQEKPYYL